MAFSATATISSGSVAIGGKANVQTANRWRWPARSQHQTIAPYSWSVIRISPGEASFNPDATRLIAAETLVVKMRRLGEQPRNEAVRSRASQRIGGACRTKKSVGPAARRWRSSVTRSKTGCGSGPKEPVLSIVTVESRINRARASAHFVALEPGPSATKVRFSFGIPRSEFHVTGGGLTDAPAPAIV
jgi:hypothetical protein